MAPYVNLTRDDILRNEDISTWPPAVVQLVQSIRDALKVPSWLKSEPPPYTDKRAVHLLDQLGTIDDPSTCHLWEHVDMVDDNLQQRLNLAFSTALSDCARIQVAIEREELSGTSVPKESFIVVLMRNAILNVSPGLNSLEDVLVALPRHFSGEPIPALRYMKRSLSAPLVISICQKMPVEDDEDDGKATSKWEDESSEASSPLQWPPSVTMSEFFATLTAAVEEVEEAVDDDPGILSAPFEVHFLAYPLFAPLPSTCHISVLCIANERQLPVVMTSLLYQRRVWHINDPLIGIAFSKYDTIIGLYVGWLDDATPDRILPCVYLGRIETSVTLDLSSPLVSLVVSRLLMSLETSICRLRDRVRNTVGTIAAQTQTQTIHSWRIDSDVRMDPLFPSENNSIRDRIIKWSQQYSVCEEDMSRRTKNPATVPPVPVHQSVP
ncbi:hypothetical protein EDC04DRAFT_732027 [Pisolithus marmoratus]|nr:hypothetical protein EDC04DRAFT_732027 [Pisolithus marmoratus]